MQFNVRGVRVYILENFTARRGINNGHLWGEEKALIGHGKEQIN